jgi:hypothetical protein
MLLTGAIMIEKGFLDVSGARLGRAEFWTIHVLLGDRTAFSAQKKAVTGKRVIRHSDQWFRGRGTMIHVAASRLQQPSTS